MTCACWGIGVDCYQASQTWNPIASPTYQNPKHFVWHSRFKETKQCSVQSQKSTRCDISANAPLLAMPLDAVGCRWMPLFIPFLDGCFSCRCDTPSQKGWQNMKQRLMERFFSIFSVTQKRTSCGTRGVCVFSGLRDSLTWTQRIPTTLGYSTGSLFLRWDITKEKSKANRDSDAKSNLGSNTIRKLFICRRRRDFLGASGSVYRCRPGKNKGKDEEIRRWARLRIGTGTYSDSFDVENPHIIFIWYDYIYIYILYIYMLLPNGLFADHCRPTNADLLCFPLRSRNQIHEWSSPHFRAREKLLSLLSFHVAVKTKQTHAATANECW